MVVNSLKLTSQDVNMTRS